MKVRIALLLVIGLVAAACDPGDIDLFLDSFPSEDLSASDDPAERAAGESAVEVLTIRQAEEELDRGIAERDIEAIQQARNLRPDDPRYDAYELAVLAGEDIHDPDNDPALIGQMQNDATQALGEKLAATRPDLTPSERGKLANEMYINALLDVIRNSPDSAERDSTIEAYCILVTDTYPALWTDRFPADVAFFLALQDFSYC